MSKKKLKTSLHKKAHDQAKFLEKIQFYEELLKNSNIQAYLLTIRDGEGTLGPNGFKIVFGGGTFEDSSHHPNIYNKKFDTKAAGGFQITSVTWAEVSKILDLQNFGSHNQTLVAVDLIKTDKAIDDILSGNIISAIRKTNRTWTSLPEGPQHRITIQEALEFYQEHGGTLNAANINYIPILNWRNPLSHPLNLDKQYPLLPENIKALMGEPNSPFINEKRLNSANKNKPSTTSILAPIPGAIAMEALGVSGAAEVPLSTWNNSLDGFYDLVNKSSSLYDNRYSYLPDVKKEPKGQVHPLIENATIQLPYFNNQTMQNETPIPYLFSNQETGSGIVLGVSEIRKRGGDGLIDTVMEQAKKKDVIGGVNKRYEVTGIQNPIAKPTFKKGADTKRIGSQKKVAHHFSDSSNSGYRAATTINLNKPMIENFIINAKDVKEGVNDLKQKIEEVLLEILNSANVIQ